MIELERKEKSRHAIKSWSSKAVNVALFVFVDGLELLGEG